jgi:hypothetical protein
VQIHPKSFKSQAILQQLQALFSGSGVFPTELRRCFVAAKSAAIKKLGEFAKFLWQQI